jgi:adenylyl cyclase-associated protein
VSKKAKKPSENSKEYLEVFGDIQGHMEAVDEHRQKNRASPLKDHLAMVADGVATLGWVAVEYKPADYAAELFGGAQMSGNKVLKQYKER